MKRERTMNKLRVFVSSVQKELELERLAIVSLITTDPFLREHCEPVLFDREPLSGRKAAKPYLDCLNTCQIYLLLINREYGRPHGDLSATHEEYRHAQKSDLPTLVFIKGREDDLREPETRAFLNEIKADGHTYKRFADRLDLQPEVREGLKSNLKREHGIVPSADEDKSAVETLAAVSPFESKQTETEPDALDMAVAKKWLIQAGDIANEHAPKDEVVRCLRARGLLWRDRATNTHFALAAGLVFLGKKPSVLFPHCRILADAYRGNEPDPNPTDQATISMPAPLAVEAVIDFIKKNTRHPPRIIGIRRVMLDEYPEKAVREAIVNAIAHRNYEDAARQILLEVFFDRVVIASPGFPPHPLTFAKLRTGKYRPCSRNPVLAQSLALLDLMEQRGSGFTRMKSAMLDHGLDAPQFGGSDGYFQLVLPGPAHNLDRLRVPQTILADAIPPSVEEQLNDRQKRIMAHVVETGFVTSGWCRKELGVALLTAQRDLSGLLDLGLIEPKGKGRSARYLLKTSR
jgi:predicted HTH transcriptional regulator